MQHLYATILCVAIDYEDYGTKLTKPQEIAVVEHVPLRQVLDDLASERGAAYHAAFASTIIFLRTTLIATIQKDPESIKLLKNLDEINKIGSGIDAKDSHKDTLPVLCEKLGVQTMDEALTAIDTLKTTQDEIYRLLDTQTAEETLFAIDMLLQK